MQPTGGMGAKLRSGGTPLSAQWNETLCRRRPESLQLMRHPLGRNTGIAMDRRVAVLLAGVLVACDANPRSEADVTRPPMTSRDAAMLDDSVRRVVERYEVGEVALSEAIRELADLTEPTGGFAVRGDQSPRATALFEATGRELRRREAERRGVPDSLVTN
jgi:hypothetical protein